MLKYYLIAFITLIAAYLTGSINFAVIFTKNTRGVDVRNFGSGNAGATNVLRVAGKKTAAATFACDFLKGALSSALGFFVCEFYLFPGSLDFSHTISFSQPQFNPIYGAFFCGAACMLGHCWPVFFGFKGGKAAATGVGIFAFCCLPAAAIGLLAFAVCFIITRKVSLGSLIATVVISVATIAAVCLNYFGEINKTVIAAVTLGMAALVFYRHRSNIERLLSGKEKDI